MTRLAGRRPVPTYRLFVLGFGLVAIFATWWLVYRTRIGAVLRATAVDPVDGGVVRDSDPAGLRIHLHLRLRACAGWPACCSARSMPCFPRWGTTFW